MGLKLGYGVEIYMEEKVYYHGRGQERAYSGSYVYITDSLEYASRYAGEGDKLYMFKLSFPRTGIFSIKNREHYSALTEAVGERAASAALRDSGDGELDWAASGYICNDEFETIEEVLSHLGYQAVRLQERAGIESLLVFDESRLELLGRCEVRHG